MFKLREEEQSSGHSQSVLAQTRLDGEAIRDVLARASELQTHAAETMSVAEVEALAREMGVSPQFVRQAVAERTGYSGAGAMPVASAYTTGQNTLVSPAVAVFSSEHRHLYVFGVGLTYALLTFPLAFYQMSGVFILGGLCLSGYIGACTGNKARAARYGAFLMLLMSASWLTADRIRLPIPDQTLILLGGFVFYALLGALTGYLSVAVDQAIERHRARRQR